MMSVLARLRRFVEENPDTLSRVAGAQGAPEITFSEAISSADEF